MGIERLRYDLELADKLNGIIAIGKLYVVEDVIYLCC